MNAIELIMKRVTRSVAVMLVFTVTIVSCISPSSSESLVLSPSPRVSHRMAYDSNRNVSVLFGGASDICEDTNKPCLFNDTWEYDGMSWKKVITQKSPSPRSSFAFGYDPNDKKIILFGGLAGGDELNDTWEYDGHNWELIQTSISPLYLDFPRMAYSEYRRSLILFGFSEKSNKHETWEYKNSIWILIDSEFVTPLPPQMLSRVIFPVLTYNPSSNTMLLQAEQGLTFEYNFSNWNYIHIQEPNLPNYLLNEIIYDTNRNKIILIVANKSSENISLWEFTDENWAVIPAKNSPSIRYKFSAIYDVKRKSIVVFGGETNDGRTLNETWEFDGTNWSQR